MGPLRFSKADLYKTLTRPFQLNMSPFVKVFTYTIFISKGLVKVSFNSHLLNLNASICYQMSNFAQCEHL